MSADQVKYLYDWIDKLQSELAKYRVSPAVPIRDWFMGCALAGLAAGSTFHDPEEAAELAGRFADAAMTLREAQAAAVTAPVPAQEGTAE